MAWYMHPLYPSYQEFGQQERSRNGKFPEKAYGAALTGAIYINIM
jgi:hypothetical protein